MCIFSRTQNIQDQNQEVAVLTRGKRKADNSPLRNDKVKRSALGNLTNNVKNCVAGEEDPKQVLKNSVQCNQKVSFYLLFCCVKSFFRSVFFLEMCFLWNRLRVAGCWS